jgi:hypothetical protein
VIPLRRSPLALPLALFATLAAGCYWSSPPAAPHGHVALDAEKAPPLAVPPIVRLRSKRVVLLGRFDSVATQPIGSMYDRQEYHVTPLYRTYFFQDAALELFEHTCDALRATGLDVRKDYASTGEPGLVEAPLRAIDPVIVSTTILALEDDQIRSDADPPTDQEVARLAARVEVHDASGKSLYVREHVVYGRAPIAPESDVLRLVGYALGAKLARDPAFLQVIGAEGSS